jgi:catechol 2,3-dioxygenase-like lactoylglutathione lyase family enzyme
MPAPARLHHHAYVVRDLRATRHFYEDLLRMPLVATWTEVDELVGMDNPYCHAFFELADGGALAFFQFAKEEDHERLAPNGRPTPFVHVALKVDDDTQAEARRRLEADGVGTLTIDHGYCVSLYASDPDGLMIELTRDHADAAEIDRIRRASATADLERWLGGDHTSNNTWRD